MGHRRLSIIDLRDAAAQPMDWEDGRYRIVFNGEIYNYRELRRQLEGKGFRFRTDGDTEVLLALYADRNRRMLDELRGMFAFAIWDEKRQGLFMARDPFGIKPLYYADDGAVFRWASQVKPLVECVPVSPDPAGHVGFFVLGSVPEPHTLYREIRALPAGHAMWVDAAGCQISPYCQVTDILRAAPAAVDQGTALEQVRGALRDSVRAHLVADVPVGVFLSAGLDSATIAALAADAGDTELRTVTLGFEEYRGTDADETRPAARLAKMLGARHFELYVSRRAFHDDAGPLLAAMDQPSIDGINSYFVSKAASEAGLKVALSGLGGDELFASYPSFRDVPRMVRTTAPVRWLPGLGRTVRVLSRRLIAWRASPKYAGLLEYGSDYGGAYLLRRGLFMPWELPELLDPDMAQVGWRELSLRLRLEETCAGMCSPRLKVSALEMAWYMRNQLLRDADWAGMAHSLEVRVPFVDVEVARRVAPLLPTLSDLSKRDVISHVTAALPQEVLDRPKSGFTVPVRDWLTKESDLSNGERGLRGWAKALYVRGGWAQ